MAATEVVATRVLVEWKERREVGLGWSSYSLTMGWMRVYVVQFIVDPGKWHVVCDEVGLAEGLELASPGPEAAKREALEAIRARLASGLVLVDTAME